MGTKKVFLLKVSTSNTYQRLCNDFVGKTLIIDNNSEFELDDMSTYKNRVRVTNVPFEMDSDVLKCLLERYGRVENITTSYKRYGSFVGILSGERIAWMVVEFPIPSSLYIKETETYINFSYLEQPMTCYKCGSGLHMGKYCDIFRTVKPKDRDNAVSLEFSLDDDDAAESLANGPDSDNEESKSTLSTDSDTENNMPLHNSTPSAQANNLQENLQEVLFACTVCDYTANQKSDLEEHVISHTGEREKSISNMFSEKVKSPKSNTLTKIPPPMAQRHISSSQPVYTPTNHSQNFISSSQPVKTSSTQLRKRQLSISPQTTVSNLTNKNARVSDTFLG